VPQIIPSFLEGEQPANMDSVVTNMWQATWKQSLLKQGAPVLPYPSPFPKLGKGIAQAPKPGFPLFCVIKFTLYSTLQT